MLELRIDRLASLSLFALKQPAPWIGVAVWLIQGVTERRKRRAEELARLALLAEFRREHASTPVQDSRLCSSWMNHLAACQDARLTSQSNGLFTVGVEKGLFWGKSAAILLLVYIMLRQVVLATPADSGKILAEAALGLAVTGALAFVRRRLPTHKAGAIYVPPGTQLWSIARFFVTKTYRRSLSRC